MINVLCTRKKVQKAIETFPSEINLKRIEKIDDGYGGYTMGPEIAVATFNGFIDFASKSPQITININDPGKLENIKNITLLVVFDPIFEIRQGDYFTYKGIKYSVKYPFNQFNIYWQCELEVV